MFQENAEKQQKTSFILQHLERSIGLNPHLTLDVVLILISNK